MIKSVIPSFLSRYHSLCLILFVASAGLIHAADVAWDPPQNVTGPADIITGGSLLAAVNADNGGDVVVDPAGLNMTFTPDNSLFPTQNPFTTSFAPSSGDAGFDAIMNRADWDGTNPNATEVVIGGLDAGQAYAIQMFVSDTRGCCNTRSMEITGGANTANVFMGDVNGSPNPAQFVIGRFTADAATQNFTFVGTHATAANLRHPQLNAYVLRTDPAVITRFTGAIDGDLGNAQNWDEGLPTNDGTKPGIVPDGFPGLFGDPGGKEITFEGTSGYDGDGFDNASGPYRAKFDGSGNANFTPFFLTGGLRLPGDSSFTWNSSGTATTPYVPILSGSVLMLSMGSFRETEFGTDVEGGATLQIGGGVYDATGQIALAGGGAAIQTGGEVMTASALRLLGNGIAGTASWSLSGGSVQAEDLEFGDPGDAFTFPSDSTGVLRVLNSAQSVTDLEALIAAGNITTGDPRGLEVGLVNIAGTDYAQVSIATIGMAAVTWDEAQNVTGPADILSTGALIAAVNADNGGDVVVDPGGLNMTFTPDNSLFPTQNPFTTSFAPSSGDAGFDAIMNRADWDGTNPNATEVVIDGLDAGQAYAIQMFVSDTRGCCNTRSMEITAGGNTANVFMGDVGGSPNPAQYVVGRFTAEKSTQQFTFTGTHETAANLRHPQLNAYVLRIAEPETPLQITSITFDEATRTSTIRWDSLPNHLYRIDASTDLDNWFELTDSHDSQGEETTFSESDIPAAAGNRRFYRVEDTGLALP